MYFQFYYCLISADVCAVLLINPTIAVTTNAIVKAGNVAPIVPVSYTHLLVLPSGVNSNVTTVHVKVDIQKKTT